MIGDIGCTVMLLAPEWLTFEGRTSELALAWCLLYLLWVDGGIGIEWSTGRPGDQTRASRIVGASFCRPSSRPAGAVTYDGSSAVAGFLRQGRRGRACDRAALGVRSMDRIRRALSPDDRRALRDAAKINVYGLGLLGLWTGINTVLLPTRVDDTAPAALRGSALGLVSVLGVGIAALVQPFAGRASDAATLPDRRRPFVAAGTLLALPMLVVIGWAPAFAWLLFGYVALQVAANVAQAAYQAFIPDLVDVSQRGLASGAKNALGVVGAAVGLLGVRVVQSVGFGTYAALAYLGCLLAATAALTVRWVPTIPPDPDAGGIAAALDPRAVWRLFAATMRRHPTFRRAVVAQFFVILGTNPAQRFLLYFLRDRFGAGAEQRASLGLAAAIVVAVVAAVAAGLASDRIGRRPVLMASAAAAALGLLGIGLAPSLALVAAAGALIAAGLGAFQSVNWAVLGDDIPEGETAAAFGLANLATAGAGAAAGLFGPLVDGLDAIFAAGTYPVTFAVAALLVACAILPLHRMSTDGDRAERDRPRGARTMRQST